MTSLSMIYQPKYTWPSLVFTSILFTLQPITSVQGADDPSCSLPAQVDNKTQNIHLYCVEYAGQIYQTDLYYKVAPDGSKTWEMPLASIEDSPCNKHKSTCATVLPGGDIDFAAANVFGTIYTAKFNILSASTSVWKWGLGSHAPKWDFTSLINRQPAVYDDFTMLIASDVHPGLCGDYGQASVIEQMNTVAQANGNTVGLIVNGDLTVTGMADKSLPFWENALKTLKFPVYEGLGNHDYINYAQVTSCAVGELAQWGVDACTVMALQHINSAIANIAEMKWVDPKSRDYAFFDKGYLFVQLQHYPSFEQDLPGTDYDTEDSMLWAKRVLIANAASSSPAPVILNVHNYYNHSNDIAEIVAEKGGEHVVGVFAGHMHNMRGLTGRIGDISRVGNYYVKDINVAQSQAQGGAIPVWYSGSMTQIGNIFTDCDQTTNTPIKTSERSFFEVKFSQQSYEVKFWEGTNQTLHYSVTW
jgi:cytolysin (calcineurin-like family phosphatase)